MTDDYRLIVPLMASVIVSLFLAERLHRESVYTLKLARRGFRLQRGHDVYIMEAVTVAEVMVPQPITVPAHLPVKLLENEFLRTGRHGFPVLDQDGSLFGMVSLTDHRRALAGDQALLEHLTIEDIATREIVSVFPDETVGTALRRMAPRDLSRLPVVARDNPRRLLGVVRRNDIVRAYEVGVMRREEARRRAETAQAVSDTQAEFVDVPLGLNSTAVGRTVVELKLPRQAVLVSIRRGRELVIPHGDTRLQAGDVVTALCEPECAQKVRDSLGINEDVNSEPQS
jgi:CIC family chloride channel protein